MSYWSGEIAAHHLTLDQVALALVHGASSQDLTVLNRKVTTATTFTAHVDQPAEISGYLGSGAFNSARTFLTAVTTAVPSDLSIDAAVRAAVAAGASSTYRATESFADVYPMASFAAGSASGWEDGGLVGLVGLNPAALFGGA